MSLLCSISGFYIRCSIRKRDIPLGKEREIFHWVEKNHFTYALTACYWTIDPCLYRVKLIHGNWKLPLAHQSLMLIQRILITLMTLITYIYAIHPYLIPLLRDEQLMRRTAYETNSLFGSSYWRRSRSFLFIKKNMTQEHRLHSHRRQASSQAKNWALRGKLIKHKNGKGL